MSLRDGPFQDIKVPLTWTAAIAVIVAAVIGLALLLGDRRETFQGQATEAARDAFDKVAKPVSGVLAAPVHWLGGGVDGVSQYFFAVSENRRLHQEVADLQHWRDEAVALRHDNARYAALLGLKLDPPIPMVSGRVIADAHGPFADTRLADVGVEQGVRIGNPVMTEHGLVGRVLGVAKGVSRILMVTDVSSRVPVMDDRTDSRAILTGDGSGSPTLEYLRGEDPVKTGDRILTSGDGGLFPRGLPVGVVYQGIDGAWRVRLDADDGPTDNVRILLFQDASQLAHTPGLNANALPPLAPADAAQVQAAANAAAASSAPTAAQAAQMAHAATQRAATATHPVAAAASATTAPAPARAATPVTVHVETPHPPRPRRVAPPPEEAPPPPDDNGPPV